MGLFSTKKTVQVSSTLYNMAGDVEDRPNFLKSNIFSHTINGDGKRFLGDTLATNYLNGPGIQQRQFHSWSVRNSFEGLPSFESNTTSPIGLDVVKAQITTPAVPAGLVTDVQSALIVYGNFQPFAEQYLLDNNPSQFPKAWTADYDAEDHEIAITYEDNTVVYVPAGIYDPNKKFLVAYYYNRLPEDRGSYSLNSDDTGVTDFSLVPDSSSYDFLRFADDESGTQSFTLEEKTTVDVTYSDSTPPSSSSSTTSTSESYDVEDTYYEKFDYQGSPDGESITTTSDREEFLIQEKRHVVVVTTVTSEDEDIGGGVTKTTTTTVETDTLEPIWDWSKNDQEVTYDGIEDGYKVFIYEIGTGNATLDGLITSSSEGAQEYFPFIPIRLNNKSITDTEFETSGLYDSSRKAYRKAFGDNGFASVVDNVEDNESLGDIDYSYISFGVPLNVIENASREYIFRFLKHLISYQTTTAAELLSFTNDITAYETAVADYKEWIVAQELLSSHARYGEAKPVIPTLNIPQITTIQLKTDDPILTDNFDNRLSWYSISSQVLSGVGKTGATSGDVWLEKDGELSWTYQKADNIIETDENGDTSETLKMDIIHVFMQTSDNQYEKLTVYGLVHNNFIYKGKSVEISAHDALDDEDESGFLIPLHEPTMKQMRLVDSTQMATANTYLVFNSYEVVKQKWYQSSIFQLVLVIAAIVISVLTYGAGSPLAVGLLGTNVGVGTALGFTGAAAVAAGAAANALAAIVLSQALQFGAKALFGDRLGGIIGAVLAFVAVASLSPGGFDLSNLMSTQNIMEFSNVFANGYKDWVQADLLEMQQELTTIQNTFEESMEYIDSMLKELGGTSDLSFNPLELTNVNAGNGSYGDYLPETSDEFIHRTTLVGSDIVDVTLAMVSDYADLSLKLPKN